MTTEEFVLFLNLRKTVWDYIAEYLKDDAGHKSYEGTFELTVCYPDYFTGDGYASGPEALIVTLHCYVLGPGRHYSWKGKTWEQALRRAERDILEWIGGAKK